MSAVCGSLLSSVTIVTLNLASHAELGWTDRPYSFTEPMEKITRAIPGSPAVPLQPVHTISCDRGRKVELLSLLGAGGTGSVYSALYYSTDSSSSSKIMKIAAKVSNPLTADRVKRECELLKSLNSLENSRPIDNIEQCLDLCETSDKIRVASALTPVFDSKNVVSSISDISDKPTMISVASAALHTALQLIVDGKITLSDVQLLIDPSPDDLETTRPQANPRSPRLLFVDFTEAQSISSIDNPSFLDKQIIANFLSEVWAFVPDAIRKNVLEDKKDELRNFYSTYDKLNFIEDILVDIR